jgi:hypothetical protein
MRARWNRGILRSGRSRKEGSPEDYQQCQQTTSDHIVFLCHWIGR